MHLTRVLLERLGRRTKEQRKELIKIDDTGVFAHFEILRKAKLTKKSFLY